MVTGGMQGYRFNVGNGYTGGGRSFLWDTEFITRYTHYRIFFVTPLNHLEHLPQSPIMLGVYGSIKIWL